MCGDYNLRREKRYVEVDVRFTPDGKIRPLAINYDKTRTYGIDLSAARAESITISLGINTSTSFVPSSRVAVKLHLWKTVNPRM